MRRALIVGINEYDPPNQLRGCVNDAIDLAAFLKTRGFLPENIRLLTDRRATRAAIEERLHWLVDRSMPGDELWFSYSGHGTQVVDRNGDELSDHEDECICPVDFDWDDPFTDDVFSQYTKRVHPEAELVVFLDSCHSGTMLRSYLPHFLTTPRTTREILPPADIVHRRGALPLPPAARLPGEGAIRPRAIGAGASLLLAACRDDQTAADASFRGRPNGAHTRAFLDTYADGETWKGATRAMRHYLSGEGYDQIPQLSGQGRLAREAIYPVRTARKATRRPARDRRG